MNENQDGCLNMGGNGFRVLRVATDIYPESVGGLGLHVHHMSRLQSQMGHKVTVLTSNNGISGLPREETREGYNIIRHRELMRLFDNSINPGVMISLKNLIGEYDILHIHSHLFFTSNIAALIGTFIDIPVVITNHGLVSQTVPRPIQTIFNYTIGKLTFEATDRIICYTRTDEDRLRNLGVNTDISIIHNGIDCTLFSPRINQSKDQLLFVGRLKPGKSTNTLIRAFKILSKKYPTLELVIVGDGPLRSELEQLCLELNIGSKIRFLGEIPNNELPKIYNESKVFVLPSLNEGLPRTVLEAMACETPVVTSALPQLEAIVEGAGFTFEPKSEDDLSECIELLLNNSSQREEMGIRGREKVMNHYSWKETVEQTIDCYQNICNND